MFEKCCITLMVADMDRSIAFYEDTLGLPLNARYGNDWAEVDLAGSMLGLHASDPTVKRGVEGHLVTLGIQVPDLDTAVSALEAKGVKFSRVSQDEAVRTASFADPDGVPLYLYQMTHHG
jgi:catechol 2,3-dioxygenase-like lactoylglutathione lyase family enzyme